MVVPLIAVGDMAEITKQRAMAMAVAMRTRDPLLYYKDCWGASRCKLRRQDHESESSWLARNGMTQIMQGTTQKVGRLDSICHSVTDVRSLGKRIRSSK